MQGKHAKMVSPTQARALLGSLTAHEEEPGVYAPWTVGLLSLLAAVTRHSHHATAPREHDAAYRRAAIGSGLRLAVRVECFGAHKAPGANDAGHETLSLHSIGSITPAQTFTTLNRWSSSVIIWFTRSISQAR